MTHTIFEFLIGFIWTMVYFGIGMFLAGLLNGKHYNRDNVIWLTLFWPIALVAMITAAIATMIGKAIDKRAKK